MIYRAANREEAERQLAAFEAVWDSKYRSVGQLWRRQWEQVVPFFSFPAEIRKIIYTTNAVESLNITLRKVIKCSSLNLI
jgi:putative transposase